jgi:hypothetical protein
VFVGNLITLVPMALNAHPGAKYGIPYPVLVRASFGIKVRAARRLGLPACPPARLPACPPARLPACPPARLPACPPACLPACPPVTARHACTPRRRLEAVPPAGKRTCRACQAGARVGSCAWGPPSTARQLPGPPSGSTSPRPLPHPRRVRRCPPWHARWWAAAGALPGRTSLWRRRWRRMHCWRRLAASPPWPLAPGTRPGPGQRPGPPGPPFARARPASGRRYGINTWIGGSSIYQMLHTLSSGALRFGPAALPRPSRRPLRAAAALLALPRHCAPRRPRAVALPPPTRAPPNAADACAACRQALWPCPPSRGWAPHPRSWPASEPSGCCSCWCCTGEAARRPSPTARPQGPAAGARRSTRAAAAAASPCWMRSAPGPALSHLLERGRCSPRAEPRNK